MTSFKTKELNTKYGIIFSRDALIIRDYSIQLKPLEVRIRASLSLCGCTPSIMDTPDVFINFLFTNIEAFSIYRIDDFPYENHLNSSFDEVEGEYKEGRKRVILSTYDHVFDIVGNIELNYE